MGRISETGEDISTIIKFIKRIKKFSVEHRFGFFFIIDIISLVAVGLLAYYMYTGFNVMMNSMNTFQESIAKVESTMDDMQESITKEESTMDDMQESITKAESTMAIMQKSITKAKSTIDTMKEMNKQETFRRASSSIVAVATGQTTLEILEKKKPAGKNDLINGCLREDVYLLLVEQHGNNAIAYCEYFVGEIHK